MNEQENTTVDLTKLKNHPVTMPLMWVAVIFMAGWVFRPVLVAYMSNDFFTVAQADDHIDEITSQLASLKTNLVRVEKNQAAQGATMDKHIKEFRIATAFQLESSLAADLVRHEAEPESTPGHAQDCSAIRMRLNLATQYKDCLLNNMPNCGVIQKQIWK